MNDGAQMAFPFDLSPCGPVVEAMARAATLAGIREKVDQTCGSFLRVHLGPVPRDGICAGCKYGATSAPPPAASAPKSATLAFADLDPAERRRFRGSALRFGGLG